MLIVAFGSTLLVGALGSLCAKKLKIPGGALIGALFFTVIFNVATGKGYFHGVLMRCVFLPEFIWEPELTKIP